MDSSNATTPISHRSSPRLLRTKHEEKDPNESHIQSPIPTLPSIRKSPTLAHSPNNPISLQELLLLSPSPYRKSRTRPRPIVVDESIESMATTSSRRKSKGRSGAGTSPRNARRARRKMEKENVREERELVPFDQNDVGGLRRRRQSSRGKVSHKDRLASLPPSSPSPKIEDDDSHRSGDGLWELILELVMWKNAAKSSLWFGIGTMLFVSSCLSKEAVNFSVVSAVSHLGLLILGLSFFYDSFPQRQQQMEKGTNFKLTEEDILRVARLMLPIANAVLAKSQEIFSGEPLMTLKVAPLLFFLAKYGQLITPWRLLAIGFFSSFTVPKLNACYCDSIHKKVEEMKSRLLEAWEYCPHKKFVAATTAAILWNIFSLKMRIFAAFISVVILRHHHQHNTEAESTENDESKEEKLQQAITVAE